MMKFLHTQWRNTVYSNVWIAVGAGLWVWSACRMKGIEGMIPAVFTASSTIFVYNFQRMIKLARRPHIIVPGRNEWLYKNRIWMGLWVIVGAAVSAYAFVQLPGSSRWFLLIPAVLALAYVFKILPGKTGPHALREIPGLKIFLIAFSWSIACGAYPMILGAESGAGIFCFGAERLFFILAITIPFDIRDLGYDSPRMRTIPQIVGVNSSIQIAQLSLAMSGLFAALTWITGATSGLFLLGTLLALLPTAWLIQRTEPGKPELFYTGTLDGMIVLQAALQLGATLY